MSYSSSPISLCLLCHSCCYYPIFALYNFTVFIFSLHMKFHLASFRTVALDSQPQPQKNSHLYSTTTPVPPRLSHQPLQFYSSILLLTPHDTVLSHSRTYKSHISLASCFLNPLLNPTNNTYVQHWDPNTRKKSTNIILKKTCREENSINASARVARPKSQFTVAMNKEHLKDSILLVLVRIPASLVQF